MDRAQAVAIFEEWKTTQAALWEEHLRLQRHPVVPTRESGEWSEYWESLHQLEYVDPGQAEQYCRYGELTNDIVLHFIQQLHAAIPPMKQRLEAVRAQYADAQAIHQFDETASLN